MQREMSAKGIKREEVHATHAVLYGAAAGYAVSASAYSVFFSGSPPPPATRRPSPFVARC